MPDNLKSTAARSLGGPTEKRAFLVLGCPMSTKVHFGTPQAVTCGKAQ
jgi:hypothetical protein